MRGRHSLLAFATVLVFSCSGRPIVDPYGAVRVAFAQEALSRVPVKAACISVDFRDFSKNEILPKEEGWARTDPQDSWLDLHEGLRPASQCPPVTEAGQPYQVQVGPLLVLRPGRAVEGQILYGLPGNPIRERCLAELDSQGAWRTSCTVNSET